MNIKNNDKILICTDGLTNCLSNEEIYNILTKNSPEKAIEVLITNANQNGGTDNITAALIF